MATRIFMISDSIITKASISRMIETEEDLEIVAEAATGQRGILMLDEINPDIVLLELTIGGNMSAIEIVKEMRNIDPNVKIVLSVDVRATGKIIEVIDAGARDFLVKPFKHETVLRVLREVASGAGELVS